MIELDHPYLHLLGHQVKIGHYFCPQVIIFVHTMWQRLQSGKEVIGQTRISDNKAVQGGR